MKILSAAFLLASLVVSSAAFAYGESDCDNSIQAAKIRAKIVANGYYAKGLDAGMGELDQKTAQAHEASIAKYEAGLDRALEQVKQACSK